MMRVAGSARGVPCSAEPSLRSELALGALGGTDAYRLGDSELGECWSVVGIGALDKLSDGRWSTLSYLQ